MIQLLVTILAFVVAISILVVVHEYGHYLMARLMGVKVLKFSVGFGRPLWRRKLGRDRTEWIVAAVPLGGFVKMLDEQEGDVPKSELHRAFNRKSLWRRSLIVLAGPLANFLFAIVAYAAINLHGVEGIRPVIGRVIENSLGAKAGFQAGDEILRIDDLAVQSWDHRRLYIYERALDGDTVQFQVRDRNRMLQDRRIDFAGVPAADVGSGVIERHIGLVPDIPEPLAVIGHVEPDSPASKAGLKNADRVVMADQQPIGVWADLVKYISQRPEQEIRLIVERSSTQTEIKVVPQPIERNGKKFGRIGAGVKIPEIPPTMRTVVRYSIGAAVREATDTTWHMSVLTLKMLWKMLRLEVSTKTISGPLTIAQYAGVSAQIGIDRFILFLAVVSVGLGVLNLLPVPILDGGHLLFYVAEGINGKPLTDRVVQWGQQIGIVLLIGLMALAFYNDIMRLLG